LKLSEIKQILAENGLRLTKSLGQNFLHDSNQLRRIFAAAELKRTDRVLEIGPGLGALTDLLVQQAGEVLAIERDARLVEVLRKRYNVGQGSSLSPVCGGDAPRRGSARESEASKMPVLRLLHADALEYLGSGQRDWSDWKLVANLPYSVASRILVELAQSPRGPERLVATVQLEVARRLMARPGAEGYGLLTLLVQLDYQPQASFKIPASCFFPDPDVDSACVCLVRRPKPLLTAARREPFAKLVKRSFSQRRKMMLKLLKAEWASARLDQAFSQLGLPLQTRAEAVTLEQFVGLTQMLSTDSET
jgi:16S rRNA (adenine1518-N6/adenine1519-N6)-dimethyltransferase